MAEYGVPAKLDNNSSFLTVIFFVNLYEIYLHQCKKPAMSFRVFAIHYYLHYITFLPKRGCPLFLEFSMASQNEDDSRPKRWGMLRVANVTNKSANVKGVQAKMSLPYFWFSQLENSCLYPT
jgi:hypothetical protein